MGKKKKRDGQVHVVTTLGMPEIRPLYPAEDGSPILTNSMLTSFRRCPKQCEYKYVHRLKPRRLGGPLKRGKWVHALLEEDAKGGDWRKLHKKLSHKFNDMFDEEKDFYGDMPTEILRIMESYFWHYKNDPWVYKEVELELTARLPNGVLLRIKFDALIENQFGLWLVDHKSHKSLPKLAYRKLDTQAPLYDFVARENGIPVQGFIWNYIKWKPPTIPKLVYANTSNPRLSKTVTETDYPTFKAALKEYGLKKKDYADRLAYYKGLRYVPGEPQTSPFFLRAVREFQPEVTREVLLEAMRTADTMNTYDWSSGVERHVDMKTCEYLCSYTDLCTAELMGGNTDLLKKQNYKVGDPMSYYHDRAGETDKESD